MNSEEISHIIKTGKLSGYMLVSGFLHVQWKTPDLNDNEYWMFTFLSTNDKLMSVEKVTPYRSYRKRQARKYAPKINALMNSLTI